MFAIFMSFIPFNTLLQQMLPFYVKQRDLFEVRESPARTFSWFAFIAAQITSEIPFQIVLGTIAYFCWYYPVGLYVNAEPTNQVVSRGVLTCYCRYHFMFMFRPWDIYVIRFLSYLMLRLIWQIYCFHYV